MTKDTQASEIDEIERCSVCLQVGLRGVLSCQSTVTHQQNTRRARRIVHSSDLISSQMTAMEVNLVIRSQC